MRSLLLLFSFALLAAEGDLQFAEIGDVKLSSGEVIRNCKLGYRTFGTLDASKSNVVLFPTWFGGQTENLKAYFGPGKLVDTGRFYGIAVDALGNGVSSSPSNGQQPFPKFTTRDMVESQHALLSKLGIEHVRAVIGISMGGMQTFEWIVAYPEFMDRAVPIIGSPRLASPDLLLWQAQLSTIELCDKGGCDPKEAMKAVLAMHNYALQTPSWRSRETSNADFPKFKNGYEAGSGRMAPADWASQLRAMMATDVTARFGGSFEKAAAEVRAEVLVVVATQDHMVNPEPALEFASKMNAAVVKLEGDCGHMATGCESAKMTPLVRSFLER
ncbi:MAG: alpha/beta fold hydrolase [Bryobacteraceae bacterium]